MGSGKNFFDFTYVGNNAYAQVLAASALVRASESEQPIPEDQRVDGEAFVVTNDEPWPFWDFARALAVAAGYKVHKENARSLPFSLCGTLGWDLGMDLQDHYVWNTTTERHEEDDHPNDSGADFRYQ